MTKIDLQTSRFLFSEIITELLEEFSKKHQYDERKEYKTEWQEWVNNAEIKPLIDEETERLRSLGFMGDVLKKMFKSARYYYRSKPSKHQQSNIKPERTYETLPIEILEKIDQHIKLQIKNNVIIENNQIKCLVKPAICFEKFCKESKSLFLELNNDQIRTNENIKLVLEKLKKTYKNRYYNIKISLQSSQ
jgi:hypothetical protein